MVEQNCVYERTMTVVYERNALLEEESNESYSKLRERVNRKLYTNQMPLVSRYNMTDASFSEVDKNDYIPHTKKVKKTSYQIINNGVLIYSNEYAHNRSQAYELLSQYALSNDVAFDDFTEQVRSVNDESEIIKEIWPTLENNKLIPYVFVDGDKSDLFDSVKVNRYKNNIYVQTFTDLDKDTELQDRDDSVDVDITFYLNRNVTELTFTISWHAPVKSTKANIEKHLVDIPEVILATVMNTVESPLNDSGWSIDEDKTFIDCVTQSNVNTKAECSPAVISSLRKTKAEL